ncbi:MAG: type II toxin-antitoxin system HicB family antitoxin [Dehalococcoidia bacterium]
MTTRSFKVLLEFDSDSQSWVTYVSAIENISTFGATKDEALENTKELILGYIEAAAKEGIPLRSS